MSKRDWQADWELCEAALKEHREACRAGGAYTALLPGSNLTKFIYDGPVILQH